jgi:hypothetical protein
MYTGLLHTHSLIRWIMLILLIMAIFRAYNGWKSKRSFTSGDKKLTLFTLIFSHVQLPDMGAAMKDKMLRFWAVEHIMMMIISILIITIGYALSKRAANDSDRFRKIFVYFLISLIIILITIPWPFTQTGAGRGWF